MVCEKLTTVCGSTIFVTVRAKRERMTKEKRAEKKNPTSEKVQEINQRNSEKQLSMILNSNFENGDIHAVLTYKDEPDVETAKKKLENFMRACQRYMKKLGKTFKAVSATEYEHKRIHHHVICNIKDMSVINKLWKSGFVKGSILDESGDYRVLAGYLIKETSKTFRNATAFSKRRFNCTRSIVRPVTKKEEVSALALFDDPKAIKDYHVDQDSIYHGTNPFDEMPYIEYVMLANDASNPRVKRWNRGRKVARPFESGIAWLKKNAGEQLELDI